MSETSTYTTHGINSVASPNNESERINLDIPDYQPTKYNSGEWVFMHWLSYLLFSVSFMVIPLYEFSSEEDIPFDFKLFATLCLLASSTIEWTHYIRGCLTPSNLNSIVKSNIDQSCYAKLMRMKLGLIYFTSVIGSIVLLCSFLLGQHYKEYEDYFIIATMVILLCASVFKLDKVVSPTKQYSCLNDLSNVFIHFLFLMGTLCYALGSSLSVFHKKDLNCYDRLHLYIKSTGGFLYVLSSLIMFYRYYCSGTKDLNMNYDSMYVE